jgi:hypothetical protein
MRAVREAYPEIFANPNPTGFRDYNAEVTRQLGEFLEAGWMTIGQVAVELRVSTRRVHRYQELAWLAGTEHEIAGKRWWLFTEADVNACKRRRARLDHYQAENWIEPDFVVGILSGRGVIAKHAKRTGWDEEDVAERVRMQVARRRADLRQRKSPGAPRAEDRHLEWVAGVAELYEEFESSSYADGVEVSEWEVVREYVRLHVAESEDRDEIERATRRVWWALNKVAERGYRTGLPRHEMPANRPVSKRSSGAFFW